MSETEAPAAATNDPRVTVHALSESLFCRRAALLGVEQGLNEDLVEDERPRWDYTPFYFLEMQLAQRLKREFLILLASLLFVVGCGVITFVMARQMVSWWILLPVSFCMLSVINVASTLRIVAALSGQWLAQRKAVPKEPPVHLTEELPVNWWELRKAGFEPLRYDDPLLDSRTNLAGKPWRVLRKGDLRIPVVRSDDLRLYAKHRARIAAHCHLLEACEGLRSPYGLILQTRSYEGIAVPNTPANAGLFQAALSDCRAFLRSVETPPPAPPSHCAQCPCGRPRLYRPGASEHHLEGVKLPIFPATANDGQTYHSFCGDRFRWIPPHERSVPKQLRPS